MTNGPRLAAIDVLNVTVMTETRVLPRRKPPKIEHIHIGKTYSNTKNSSKAEKFLNSLLSFDIHIDNVRSIHAQRKHDG